MKLENSMFVPAAVKDAWEVLLDFERIAPCVPGATLVSRDGDTYHGKVKVKVGPMGLSYSGTVTLVSADEGTRTAVLQAAGRETRGSGTAQASVLCRLTEEGAGTRVAVETDLAITGKPAQFGRGVLSDVAAAMIDQFAANLSAEIAPGGGVSLPADHHSPSAEEIAQVAATPSAISMPIAHPTDPVPAAAPAAQQSFAPRPSAEPFDLLQVTGKVALGRVGQLTRYAVPAAIGAVALVSFTLGVKVGRRLPRRR